MQTINLSTYQTPTTVPTFSLPQITTDGLQQRIYAISGFSKRILKKTFVYDFFTVFSAPVE